VAATIKCRIERHDDRIEAFFDSIDPTETWVAQDVCSAKALFFSVAKA
jgi:hypothetical protein